MEILKAGSSSIRWKVKGLLAWSARPGYPADHPTLEEVTLWLEQARQLQIRSILCILSEEELHEHYGSWGISLLDEYRWAGFEVAHLPADDHQAPSLNSHQEQEVRRMWRELSKLCLVHCSAGMDRTGRAMLVILEDLKKGDVNHCNQP